IHAPVASFDARCPRNLADQLHATTRIHRARAATPVIGFATNLLDVAVGIGTVVAAVSVATIVVDHPEIRTAPLPDPDAVAAVAPGATLDAGAAGDLPLEHHATTTGGALAGAAIVGFAADGAAAGAIVLRRCGCRHRCCQEDCSSHCRADQ